MNFKSYSDLSNIIKNNLHQLQEQEFDLIVGLPRSGMIPAYMIALALNLNCTDINSFVTNVKLAFGNTRKVDKNTIHPWEAKKILVVDDSINTGESMRLALLKIPEEYLGEIKTLAIYSAKRRNKKVDLYFEFVPVPRAFEWNIFHHKILASTCINIDGFFFLDPVSLETSNENNKISFQSTAKAYIVPTCKVNTLVSKRPEKYRCQVESWLNEHGIEYVRLVMLGSDGQSVNHSMSKAKLYASRPELDLFIESDPSQAISVMRMSSKPVFCVKDNKLYFPNIVKRLYKDPSYLRKLLRRNKNFFPLRLQHFFRFFYKKLFNKRN